MPRSIPAPAAPRRVRRPGATAVVAALAAGLALPAAARAQDAPSSPTPSAPPPSAVPAFPDTPLGRRASALLAAIDGGDSVAIARFVDAHLGRDLMRGRSPAAVRTSTRP